MADLKSKQIKFPLTETNVVSSSAQIATDISGSFVDASGSFSTRITTDSGSFSTRVTTAESELGNTLISGSAQIATDISGSFVAPSASFSTRVTTAETELGNTLLSGSAQIATDISGSFVAPSASFSTRVTTAETELGNTLLSSSAQISDDISGSLSAAAVVGLGAGIISGSSSNSNLTTAIVSEGANIVSSSAQVSVDVSGSFTGELSGSGIKFIGGGVSGSLVSTGSFGRIEAISGSIGNVLISENGTLSGSGGRIKGFSQIGDSTLTTFNGDFLGTSGSFLGNLGVGLVFPKEKLEISGNVSGSGSGSFLNINVTDNISAANISASVVQATQGTIDHDSLSGFVGNEHIDHSGVDITAGAGLTGGGDITSTRTLAVGQGTGVTVNANDVAIGQAVETDSNVQFNHISASGNISSSRGSLLGFDSGSFNINLGVGTTTPAESLEVVGAISASTSGSFLNIDAPHIKATSVHGTILTATQGTIDHDSLANFVGNEHVDHSGVTITAGDGLTGGGTIASTRTLAVGEGTGVTVNANDVAIGQDVATNANVNFASVTTTGNIVAQGDITAQNYIVSSSVTHMTSSIRSGSTVSGDTPADDTHQFTGSLSISGSSTDITNTMTASLASIFLQNNGHISSSLGTIKGFSAINGTTITGTTFTGVSGSFSENLGVNTTTPAEALEVVGSVSASASGSFLNVDITDNLGVTGVFTLPNIANVSASIASAVAGGDDLGNHTATQDLDMDGNDIFDVQHISGSGNISGSLGNILGYKSGSFQQLDAIVVSASSVQATNLLGLVGTATQGTIDHDSLANFVANEHVDHTSITLTAGDGLSGGGTIAANRSFAVDATVLRTTGDSVISSSAQLADDISGSFSTAAVVGLGAGIISGSSSNSSLTTAIVSEGAGILSGSAQIATSISGSLSAAAIVGLGAGIVSGSTAQLGIGTSNPSGALHIFASDGLEGATPDTDGDNFIIESNADTGMSIISGEASGETGALIFGHAADSFAAGLVYNPHGNQLSLQTQQASNTIRIATGNNDESFIFSGANLSGSQASTGSFGVLETHGNVNVTTTGRLGVGTDDPDFKLDVAGNAGFNEYIRHNGDNDTHIRFQANQVDISAGGNIYSYDGAAFNLTGHLSASGNISGSQIEASGDIIAFGSSDRNLKDNIQPIENPLEKMEKIGGYTFVWNNKQSTYQGKDVGVVAQEIQEVLPEIVSGRANGYLGVKYEKIVPLLIESIKENTKKIKELEQEINEINKNCDCLSK